MAAGSGPGPTGPNRSLNLETLLVAGRGLLRQSALGLDPALPSTVLSAVAQAAAALTADFTPESWSSHEPTALWCHPGQDAAAYVALFSLALRRSSPSATGQGTKDVYARILSDLCRQLGTICHMTEPVALGRICRDLLAAALLRQARSSAMPAAWQTPLLS